jgi:hypothetical protein
VLFGHKSLKNLWKIVNVNFTHGKHFSAREESKKGPNGHKEPFEEVVELANVLGTPENRTTPTFD